MLDSLDVQEKVNTIIITGGVKEVPQAVTFRP